MDRANPHGRCGANGCLASLQPRRSLPPWKESEHQREYRVNVRCLTHARLRPTAMRSICDGNASCVAHPGAGGMQAAAAHSRCGATNARTRASHLMTSPRV